MLESLAQHRKAFVRRYRDFSKENFPYIAVPEHRPTNPKHLHTWPVKLSIARHLWRNVCGGRGINVDVRRFKIGKIACYILKYI